MSRFHSNNGLYFERTADGGVRVSHWMSGVANAGRADQASVDVLDRSWTLTAPEWASVVASVSQMGESSETWQQALDWHGQEPTS